MPQVAPSSLSRLHSSVRKWAIPAHVIAGRRTGAYRPISIQSTPSTETTRIEVVSKSTAASSPDATFEVLGAPYSMLSVSLSPSQSLYTRRGTLVGISSAEPDSTISRLRLLKPVQRLPLAIPFLYQKITSTTQTSLLIAPKSPITSFAILQLDGTSDWKITQRSALLAWTGTSLNLKPTINASLSVAHWSNTDVTGRGLLALAGKGQLYTLDLAKGETYIAHPAHVLAYSRTSNPPPRPFRFKSSTVKIAIPLSLGNWFPSSNFVRNIKNSDTYRGLARFFLSIRTWSRRTIWGDRLFLKFEGPATLLLQSRGGNIREILSSREVNEIADSPAGGIDDALYNIRKQDETAKNTVVQQDRMGVQGATVSAATTTDSTTVTNSDASSVSGIEAKDTKLKVTGISEDGKVKFEAKTK